jgi:RHS repeat-associated protein
LVNLWEASMRRRWAGLVFISLFASCQGFESGDRPVGSVSLALDPALPPDALTNVVVATEGHPGSMQGNLTVSHTGVAHYSIPISVPPGRDGMTPELSLEYTSEGSDGLFGVGWSLSVFSLVHRCPRDRAHDGETDGLDWSDSTPWCLDGQRREDVLDQDGIIDWQVIASEHHLRTRDGRLLIYGGSGAEWVGAGSAGSGKPFGYALRRVEDRAGNSIAFVYTQSASGQLRPTEILYTGHASLPAMRKIVFGYEARSHVVPRFIDGRSFSNDGRLHRIEAWTLGASPTKVWEYALEYVESPHSKRSLLSRVRHCDRGSPSVCRSPLSFAYSGDAMPHGTGFSYGTGISLDREVPLTGVGDVSGDGVEDLVGQAATGGFPGLEVFTQHGSPGASASDPWQIVQTDLPSNWAIDGLDIDGDGRGEILTNEPLSTSGDVGTTVRELVPTIAGGLVSEFHVDPPTSTSGGGWAGRLGYGFADADGDGVPDWVTLHANAAGVDTIELAAHAAGAPYGSWGAGDSHVFPELGDVRRAMTFVDLRGDGRTEALVREQGAAGTGGTSFTAVGLKSDGSAELPPTIPMPALFDAGKYVFLDMNGDGLPDLLELPATGYDLTVRYNTGRSFEPPQLAVGSHPVWWRVLEGGARDLNAFATGFRSEDVLVADLNRDGMDDFILLAHDEFPSSVSDWMTRYEDEFGQFQPCYWATSGEARMAVHLSNGRTFDVVEVRDAGERTQRILRDPGGFAPPTGREGCEQPNGWGHVVLADLLGADGLYETTYAAAGSRELRVNALVQDIPDRLLKVTRDEVALAQIEYGALRWTDYPTDLAEGMHNYEPATGCEYPQRCVNEPRWVVLRHSTAIDSTHWRDWEHRYSNAREDVRGWGFLGFQTHWTLSADGMRRTIEETHLDQTRDPETGRYPKLGRPTFVFAALRAGTTEIIADFWANETTYQYDTGNNRTRLSLMTEQAYEGTSALDWSQEFPWLQRGDPNPDFFLLRNTRRTYTWNLQGVNTRVDEEVDYDLFTPGSGAELSSIEYTMDPRFPEESKPTSVRVTNTLRATGATRTRETTLGYDARGLLNMVMVDPTTPTDRLRIDYARDAFGLVTGVTQLDVDEAVTRTTTIAYDDEQIWPQRFENALGHVSWVVREPSSGVAVFERDPNGVEVRRKIDGFGRLRRESGVFGVRERRYNAGASGQIDVVNTADSGGSTTERYDAFGRVVRLTRAGIPGILDSMESFTYDAFGRVYQHSEPEGDMQTFTYDVLDRVRQVLSTGAGVPATTTSITYDDYTQTTVDAGGNTHRLVSDYVGRTRESRRIAAGVADVVTNYEYGPFGVLTRVTDDSGVAWAYSHNSRGEVSVSNDPDAGMRTFTYNAFGELEEERGPGGALIRRHEYDALGRPVLVDGEDGVTSFDWDSGVVGVLASSTSPDGAVWTYDYDNLGRRKRETLQVDGRTFDIGYEYDAFSRLGVIEYPQVGTSRLRLKQVYNARGDLQSVTNESSGLVYWQSSAEDERGRVTEERFGNNVRTLRAYHDVYGSATSIRTGVGVAGWGPTIQDLAYEYRNGGNLERRRRWASPGGPAELTDIFDYDTLDRLKRWSRGAVVKGLYEYDRIGNLQQRGTTTLTYGPAGAGPHRVEFMGGVDVVNDNRGRRDAWADVTDVTYNSYDLPRSITRAATTVSMLYDASGARVAKSRGSTRTYYVRGLYEQRVSGATTTHVLHVHGREREVAQISITGATTKVFYLHHDSLGSLDAVTNSTGVVVEQLRFDPFGARVQESGDPLPAAYTGEYRRGFTSHEQDDDLGLIHMGGRVYDPGTARFLTPDPIIGNPLHRESLNAYEYGLNSPMRFTDPSGMLPYGYQERPPVDGSAGGGLLGVLVCGILGCGGSGGDGGGGGYSGDPDPFGQGGGGGGGSSRPGRPPIPASARPRPMDSASALSPTARAVREALDDIRQGIQQFVSEWFRFRPEGVGFLDGLTNDPGKGLTNLAIAAILGADLSFDDWMDALAYSHTRELRHGLVPSHLIKVDEDSTYYRGAELGGQLAQAAVLMAIPGPDAPPAGTVATLIQRVGAGSGDEIFLHGTTSTVAREFVLEAGRPLYTAVQEDVAMMFAQRTVAKVGSGEPGIVALVLPRDVAQQLRSSQLLVARPVDDMPRVIEWVFQPGAKNYIDRFGEFVPLPGL